VGRQVCRKFPFIFALSPAFGGEGRVRGCWENPLLPLKKGGREGFYVIAFLSGKLFKDLNG